MTVQDFRPAWEYLDSRDQPHTGYLENFVDAGGTDVTYFMRDSTTGELTLLSGSRLKAARPTGSVTPLWTPTK